MILPIAFTFSLQEEYKKDLLDAIPVFVATLTYSTLFYNICFYRRIYEIGIPTLSGMTAFLRILAFINASTLISLTLGRIIAFSISEYFIFQFSTIVDDSFIHFCLLTSFFRVKRQEQTILEQNHILLPLFSIRFHKATISKSS